MFRDSDISHRSREAVKADWLALAVEPDSRRLWADSAAAPSVECAKPRPSDGAVCVVIPAHDGGAALLESIRTALDAQTAPEQVIVVDNASTDGSIDDAMRAFPGMTLLRNSENLGFAAACNFGIAEARRRGAAFVLLLNQDAMLAPGALASMVALARERTRAAAIGARTLSLGADGTDSVSRLLYDGSWRRALPLWQRIPGVDRPFDRTDSRSVDCAPREVDFIWGHAMLLRCDALDEVGGFDERFFMYYEDIDLCDRMQKAGWQLWCDSRAIVWHDVSDAARTSPSEPWRWQWKQDSARRFLRKRMGGLRADACWILSSARELAALLLRRRLVAAAHFVHATGRVAVGAQPRGRP